MTKRLPIFILSIVLLTACTTGTSTDTKVVDDVIQSKRLGNNALVNDIAAQNSNAQTQKPAENVDLSKEAIALKKDAAGQPTESSAPKTEQPMDTLTTVNELQMQDIVVGTGDEAVAGKTVTVHYTGKLTNGQKFDSSLDRNQPFNFTLGAGQVIKGWDEGVKGMKVGGKRTLTIPSDMAYGERGVPGAIPGGATLVFDVELLAVK